MDERLKNIITGAGFAECFALEPAPIPGWDPGIAKGAAELLSDPGAAYPEAKSILLLIYPYRPFRPEERIPAYYPASNSAYFAAGRIITELREMGYYAERANIPARAFALANGIGDMGRNGLLRLYPHGSCIVLETVATNAAPWERYHTAHQPCPESCTACSDACPAKAIAGSRDIAKCMRLYMENNLHPEWIRETQRHHIGCEECIRVCPFNTVGGYAEPSVELCAAFDMAALIRGDAAPARRLVGKNMTGGGKLTSEAIAMAARESTHREDIEAALDSPFEGVREAAKWALNRYFR